VKILSSSRSVYFQKLPIRIWEIIIIQTLLLLQREMGILLANGWKRIYQLVTQFRVSIFKVIKSWKFWQMRENLMGFLTVKLRQKMMVFSPHFVRCCIQCKRENRLFNLNQGKKMEESIVESWRIISKLWPKRQNKSEIHQISNAWLAAKQSHYHPAFTSHPVSAVL
jgi:hypothetical protein